jgi:hypothetical protein
MAAKLPDAIRRYQDAHDGHDVDGALAVFAADASVRDEGQDWVGPTEIRNWLNKTSSEYTFTRTLLSVEETGAGSWAVRNRLEGNFPGNVVDLVYRFELHGDHIARLTIAP